MAGCGLWADKSPKPRVLDDDFARVLRSDTVAHFHDLVGDSFVALDPTTARLVGPTYGVAFDAGAVTSQLDGHAFHRVFDIEVDEFADNVGEVSAATGTEFVLVHVIEQPHLPEPELGYGSLFCDWSVAVDGQSRSLTDTDGVDPPCIGTGATILIHVPAGAAVQLGAEVNGRAQWLDLRTGAPIR
jgi:hypothetical protein